MFVLLFAYVFGSSIDVPGVNYREFLIAGIFAQTVVFGATFTGAGLAEDMPEGRHRPLPVAADGPLRGARRTHRQRRALQRHLDRDHGDHRAAGRLAHPHARCSRRSPASLLLLLFAYAFSWVMAWVGLLVPSPEVVNNASFMVIFPLTFIANTFVPSENLPTPLRTFAEWNPVSAVTQAARELFGNTNPAAPPPDVWSLQNPVLYTLIWVAIILVVFVPLANRQYRKATSR